MPHALIVDDDVATTEAMAALVAAQRFSAAVAHTIADARRELLAQRPDVVLLDLHLPDGSGFELIRDASKRGAEVVLITAHASVESSVQALRLGAADYLTKPVDLRRLRGILSRVMSPSALKAELDELLAQCERDGHFGELWGRSPPMRRLYEQIGRVAVTAIGVFITGESGTGKELVARTVHALSRRRQQAFVAVNCGAISPQLIESELFGHEKGAFTGADRQHIGLFERAGGGTLFLDEITEMPPELQVKLLRVLETGMFMRVGSTESRSADVRIIAATNRSPMQAVAEGRLREDLLYRLNVFPLQMPPLRERGADVELLAKHFLMEVGEREGQLRRFDDAALRKLRRHRWPGNVRELRNAVQRAYLMAGDAPVIGEEWLPGDGPGTVVVSDGGVAGQPSITIPVGTSILEAERQLILATLAHYGQSKERAAAALGVSLKTVYNRLKEYAAAPSSSEPPRRA